MSKSILELKEELGELELPLSGNKDKLLERLDKFRELKWKHKDGLYYSHNKKERSSNKKIDEKERSSSQKVAAFDFDHTLFQPKHGKKFSKNGDDFELMFGSIPDVLKCLSDEGYLIVIFTNQSSKPFRMINIEKIRKAQLYLESLSQIENIPVYISISRDKYRKPNSGMFKFMKKDLGTTVDKKASFYCGNAAGRVDDFADSDLGFARNSEIYFFTPEEVFEGDKIDIQLFLKTGDTIKEIK